MNRKIKAVIYANGDTCASAARKLKMSVGSFSKKMNGKIPFNADEMLLFKDTYNLSWEELTDVFFKSKVA